MLENIIAKRIPTLESSFTPYFKSVLEHNNDSKLKICSNHCNRSRNNRLYNMTEDFVHTYKLCNPQFRSIETKPQRILTQPSEPLLNNKHDNEESNLICKVHDILQSHEKKFIILDLLGTGTFGQVFRCQVAETKEIVAVKVIKNKPAYHKQGVIENKIVKLLNTTYDHENQHHIVRLLDSFEYCNHICLVFELLSMSLLDLLTQNQFRGLPVSVVQRFTREILIALVAMEEANVIHCDLKPENILLVPQPSPSSITLTKKAASEATKSFEEQNDGDRLSSSNTNQPLQTKTKQPLEESCVATEGGSSNEVSNEKNSANGITEIAKGSTDSYNNNNNSSKSSLSTTPTILPASHGGGGISSLKVIDFGSACFEGRTAFSYIQSRFYRSPEVLLGIPYNGAIDIWSLGCVCAEMFLGLPLFPGVSQHNQLSRIVEMFGIPPDFLIEGRNGFKYFTRLSHIDPIHKSNYRIKSPEEYALENNTEIPILRKYLRYNRLDEVIMRCPLPQKARMNLEQKNIETVRRRCFLDFLQGLLQQNPFERWTAKQAMGHPFILNTNFTSPYQPLPDKKTNERKLNFMLLTQKKLPSSSTMISTNKPLNPALMKNKVPIISEVPTKVPIISEMTNKVPVISESTAVTSSSISSTTTVPSISSNTTTIIPTFYLELLQQSNRTLTEPVTAMEYSAIDKLSGPMLKRGAPVHLTAESVLAPQASTSQTIPTNTTAQITSNPENASKPIPIMMNAISQDQHKVLGKSTSSVKDILKAQKGIDSITSHSYSTSTTSIADPSLLQSNQYRYKKQSSQASTTNNFKYAPYYHNNNNSNTYNNNNNAYSYQTSIPPHMLQQQQQQQQIWNHPMNPAAAYHAYSPQQYFTALPFQHMQQQQQTHNVPSYPVYYSHQQLQQQQPNPSMQSNAPAQTLVPSSVFMHNMIPLTSSNSATSLCGSIDDEITQDSSPAYSTIGSIQENYSSGAHAMMTDFGFAITRPELDEQRKLQSSNSLTYYWQPIIPQTQALVSSSQQPMYIPVYQHPQQISPSIYIPHHQQQQTQQPNIVYSYATNYSHMILPPHPGQPIVATQQMAYYPPNYNLQSQAISPQSSQIYGSYDSKTMSNLKRSSMKNNNKQSSNKSKDLIEIFTNKPNLEESPIGITNLPESSSEKLLENIDIKFANNINNDNVTNTCQIEDTLQVSKSPNIIRTSTSTSNICSTPTTSTSHRKLRSKTDISNISISYLTPDIEDNMKNNKDERNSNHLDISNTTDINNDNHQNNDDDNNNNDDDNNNNDNNSLKIKRDISMNDINTMAEDITDWDPFFEVDDFEERTNNNN